ncbi:MAG: YihY/virulence factor BrkB family protein [Mogibacterium sp.]|nr:YihY/virulence factor BrkB family protein [Mogibacterium sp.]
MSGKSELGKHHQEKPRATGKSFVKIGFHIWRQFDDPYYAGFAASIAYFFFMASMPTLVVLSQFLGIFDISLDFIKVWLEAHLDESMSGIVMQLFTASSVQLSNFVMIIVALWSASALEFSLARLTSHVLSEGTYRFNFWSERFKAIPTAALTIVTIGFTLIIYVYGEQLTNRLLKYNILAKVLVALKLPIVAGLFFAMILFNYYILPRIRVPLRAVLPGAVFATVALLIVTAGFGLYIGHIAHYNILYGVFANIVALMLWFYLISWVLCIGMMFNKAWDDVMRRNRLSQKKLMRYLGRQLRSTDDYQRFFVHEDDFLYPERDTLAVRMSRKYVEDYDKELKRQKKEAEDRIRAEKEALELYEELMKDR